MFAVQVPSSYTWSTGVTQTCSAIASPSFSDMPRKSLQVCAAVRVTETTCNRLGVLVSVCMFT